MTKIVPALLLSMFMSSPAFAMLHVVGDGASMHLDSSLFPPDMKASYEILKVKCVKCHTQERIISAVTSGLAPITGQPFDGNSVRIHGKRLVRRHDANMTRSEVERCANLVEYLLRAARD